MKEALWVVREAFTDVWDDLWTMLVCNLLWYLANILVIPGPPATLALMHFANRLTHGETADLGDFWKAFRHYWWPAWRWGAINLGAIVFLLADIILIGPYSQDLWSQYLTALYAAFLAAWLILQFFALPFFFEQQTMSVRQALQNGAALIGKNPGFSIILMALLLLILVVGIAAFMLSFMLGAALLACAANHAVINRLQAANRAEERA